LQFNASGRSFPFRAGLKTLIEKRLALFKKRIQMITLLEIGVLLKD
jgi:hypothetical protein